MNRVEYFTLCPIFTPHPSPMCILGGCSIVRWLLAASPGSGPQSAGTGSTAMFSYAWCLPSLVYLLGRVDCVLKDCNSTVDLLPGTLIRLVNPPRTDQTRNSAVTCWYTIRLTQGISGGIICISIDRFSIGKLENKVCVGGHLQVCSS